MTELSKQDKEDLNTLQALYKMFVLGDILVFVLGVPLVQAAQIVNAGGGPEARKPILILVIAFLYGVMWSVLHAKRYKTIQKLKSRSYVSTVNFLTMICLTPIHSALAIWCYTILRRENIKTAFDQSS